MLLPAGKGLGDGLGGHFVRLDSALLLEFECDGMHIELSRGGGGLKEKVSECLIYPTNPR